MVFVAAALRDASAAFIAAAAAAASAEPMDTTLECMRAAAGLRVKPQP